MAKLSIGPRSYDTEDVYKGAYAARTATFMEEGAHSGFRPAHTDKKKIAAVLIDYQYDFCHPSGALPVPGSLEDISRFLQWFYTNGEKITTVYVSLDTHVPLQIFFPSWWRDDKGQQPPPFTPISEEDVRRGKWRPVIEATWSLHYVKQLQRQAKKDLMIWPYHTMEGTIGHTLIPPISEALAWHSEARKRVPVSIIKGRTLRTEYYGAFGAEVPDPSDPSSGLNTTMLDVIMGHDEVYFFGEAETHCVLETERQAVERFGNQPDVLGRMFFVRDCTSPVLHPAIDFHAQAVHELTQMEAKGVQMVLSGDPLR